MISPSMSSTIAAALTLMMLTLAPPAQELPRGQVIASVACAADPTQSYALYLPSTFTPDRPWPLLMGFSPSGNGRSIVELYRAAAEQYGYIVVASNNSRNGPWEVSGKAVQVMSADVGRRFAIAAGRFYMTGMSGGARVALQVALATKKIDGVIASSAGYPDSQPRGSVPFVLFGTAGTEDFNYVEMKLLGRELKTPHRIVIFEGGHQLPPPDVAMQAIEWLEVQAMAKGSRTRDAALIDRLFDKGMRAAEQLPSPAAQASALDALAIDFKGVRDVAALRARVDVMMKDKDIKRGVSQERSNDLAEARMMNELIDLQASLKDDAVRAQSLFRAGDMLRRMYTAATAPDDSPERQQARRVLRAVTSTGEQLDPDFQRLLNQYRLPGGRGRGRS